MLDYLEGAMNPSHGGNNICEIISLYTATLYSGGNATVDGFIGAISTTFDGVVTP